MSSPDTLDGAFRFAYDPPTVVYGPNAVASLGEELERCGAERAMVVAGRTTGTTDAVVGPVRDGGGERVAEVFAETTPDKRLRTAHEAAERARELDADALVGLGSGSSIDVTAFAAILFARNEPFETIHAEFVETGGVAIPEDADLLPLLSVPTTLAGAELSAVAGITTTEDGALVRGGAFDGRVLPEAIHYDRSLFETTPRGVLCASAMNGFDKGVETLYSPNGTPVTDGTAIRGLRHLQRGLPALGAGERDAETLRDAVVGTMLVQYGVSRADGPENQTLTLSLIHAFGHGIARGYAVQQGGAHGIIAPHALRALFERVDANRDLLAEALDVDAEGRSPEETAEAVVAAVTEVRDALSLPTRLRDVEDMDESDLPSVAESVHGDGFMAMTPAGYDPSVEELEAILREAW
jgi:alcohol dehydrogenase